MPLLQDASSALMPACSSYAGRSKSFDAIVAMSHTLLQGSGKQAIGWYTKNILSNYMVVLQLALALASELGLKLQGMWAGRTIGLGVYVIRSFTVSRHGELPQSLIQGLS